MKGQRKTQAPCPECLLHHERCICEFIPKLDLRTKLSLVIHYRELKRTTNTGTLALKALTNSQMLVRGEIGSPLNLASLVTDNYRSLLFYPAEGAIELTQEFIEQSPLPIQLIVPDGNWRQASKVHYRHHELQHLTRVTLKAPIQDGPLLRTETKPEGMATLQAIAYALGIIEGPSVQDSLLKLYQLKLERTLQGRGQKLG